MPHATHDETMGGIDEDEEMKRFLGNGMGPQEGEEERSFDQAGKADDAIDYEDISDDDLPEEQEGTGEDAGMDMVFEPTASGLGGLPVHQPPNGYHDVKEAPSSDAFGESDEFNDLFGDRISSPEEERRPAPQHRPSGLALPTKSGGLALPGAPTSYQQLRMNEQRSPSSLSPPLYGQRESSAMSPAESDDDSDEEGLSKEALLQRRLFKSAGKGGLGEPVETDMELFNTLFSGYDKAEAPRFIDLFPPRNVEYKGKLPPKPPKAVQPTKLSLDLLHDQERSFKTVVSQHKTGQESTFNNSIVTIGSGVASSDDSDDDFESGAIDEAERIGGITMQDLAFICQDWDALSAVSGSAVVDFAKRASHGGLSDGDYESDEQMRPSKKRKTGPDVPLSFEGLHVSFEDPEHAVSKLAKAVALDLNDPNLLLDEHAPRTKRNLKRVPGDKRDAALSRDIAKRYNISNDQAYDLLKENHQHKVRSTLGSMAVEHSLPATKLQYPFYRVGLDSKAKRAFHRSQLDLKQPAGKEYRFTKPKHIKRKNIKGREAKDVFAKAEDLSLGDNASLLLLEYSEEAPMMMSNFGMGNRLINYYRKKDADDNERPKREIGEAQVLLTQDKSPFANFGHVDKGETVPTIQNGLYRAPVFSHNAKTTDFIIGISSTYENGDRFFLRNVENLHVVGQQFPLAEVPGQHSRKVTDAAKKRLRALSYRIYTKSLDRRDKVLDNATLMPHLPGHDMPQTRSKMREFMRYERVSNRGDGSSGVWVPQPGQPVPDTETLRSWIRPEDVCLLDSMQVGVQHLSDLGISETKEADEDKEMDVDGAGIEQQLAPWRASKNFLNACQGKAMLALHGDGDPTNRGEGLSFVKISMKGGFQAVGESAGEKMAAEKRKKDSGHSYNVQVQQKVYDDSIRRIWDAQKTSLSNDQVYSDDDMDDEPENDGDYSFGRANTPRSSFSTPAAFAARDDMSQFSGHSAGRGDRSLTILRSGGTDAWGAPREPEEVTITDPRVIKAYKQRQMEKQFKDANLHNLNPTGDPEKDQYAKQQLEKELARIQRNADRREAREKLKAKNKTDGSPSAVPSPAPSDADGPATTANGNSDITPQKGKGRSKDGTARKCANCGQVGHIKTNRKSVSTFTCKNCKKKNKIEESGSHGRQDDAGANVGNVAPSFVNDSYSAFVL